MGFLLKDKSEVFQLFVDFFHMVRTQFAKSIKSLQSDNGKKYENQN